MTETLTVTITAKDGASQTFKAVGSSAQKMGQELDRAGKSGAKSVDGLTKTLDGLEGELTTVGTALTVFGAATLAAFGLAAKGSIQLESAMANVNSIAGLTDTQLADLTGQVRDLSVEMATPGMVSRASATRSRKRRER